MLPALPLLILGILGACAAFQPGTLQHGADSQAVTPANGGPVSNGINSSLAGLLLAGVLCLAFLFADHRRRRSSAKRAAVAEVETSAAPSQPAGRPANQLLPIEDKEHELQPHQDGLSRRNASVQSKHSSSSATTVVVSPFASPALPPFNAPDPPDCTGTGPEQSAAAGAAPGGSAVGQQAVGQQAVGQQQQQQEGRLYRSASPPHLSALDLGVFLQSGDTNSSGGGIGGGSASSLADKAGDSGAGTGRQPATAQCLALVPPLREEEARAEPVSSVSSVPLQQAHQELFQPPAGSPPAWQSSCPGPHLLQQQAQHSWVLQPSSQRAAGPVQPAKRQQGVEAEQQQRQLEQGGRAVSSAPPAPANTSAEAAAEAEAPASAPAAAAPAHQVHGSLAEALLQAAAGGIAGGTSAIPSPPSLSPSVSMQSMMLDAGALEAAGSRAPSPTHTRAAAHHHSLSDWEVAPSEIEICRRPDGSLWQCGVGGFGRVYKAMRFGVQPVAVKVLAPAGEARYSALEDFKREVALLKACRDANIVAFLGASLAPDFTMLVTEYCGGGSLAQNLAAGRVSWYRRGKEIALDVARGLAYLHGRRIIHFDLKSPNILLDRHWHAKIADVGLAKIVSQELSAVTGNIGTLSWAAPEMLLGQRCTEKADIYSFGVVLWEVCTAAVPARGRMRTLVPPADCPAPVVALVAECMDPDPLKRPSAQQLVERLQRVPDLPSPAAAAAAGAAAASPSAAQQGQRQSPGPGRERAASEAGGGGRGGSRSGAQKQQRQQPRLSLDFAGVPAARPPRPSAYGAAQQQVPADGKPRGAGSLPLPDRPAGEQQAGRAGGTTAVQGGLQATQASQLLGASGAASQSVPAATSAGRSPQCSMDRALSSPPAPDSTANNQGWDAYGLGIF